MFTSNLSKQVKVPVPKVGIFKAERHISLGQLLVFMLVFAAIGGYIIYSSFASAPIVASLAADQMSLPAGATIYSDSTASTGQAVRFTADGTAGASVTIPSGSTVTSLTLLAESTQCHGWPTASLNVDGTATLPTTAISTTSWSSYAVNVNLTSGSHNISLVAGNIGSKGNCARTLTVDAIIFYGPVPTIADTTAPSVPNGLTSPSQTASSITLGWSASTDPDSAVAGYNIYRNGTKVGNSTATSYTDSGLTAGTNYTYTVSAYDSSSNTGAQSTALTVSTQVSTSSTNVAPTLTLNTTTNTISWSAQGAATGYQGATSNGPRTLTTRTTTYAELGNVTSWTPAAPPCGTTYYYGVASEGPAGTVGSTNEVAISGPACGTNTAPTLSLNAITHTITWSGQGTTTGYQGATSNGPRTLTTRTTTYAELGNVTSWTPQAACGQTLYYGLASEGTSGYVWSTNEVSITWPSCTDTTLPTVAISQPTSGATVSGTTPITANAGDNVAVAKVEFYVDGTLLSTVTSSPYTTSWNTTVVTNGSHTVMAKAYDTSNNTNSSSVTVTVSNTDTTPPTAPGNLTASVQNATQVTLSWTASTDPDSAVAGYRVERNGVVIATVTGTNYSDTTVSAGTTYNYNVLAYDPSNNVSSPSNTATVTTPTIADTTPPTTPGNLTASTSGAQVNLSWTASTDTGGSGLAGYKIYRNGVQIGTSTTTTYGDATVSSGNTYTYYIVAYDGANNVSPSSSQVSISVGNVSPTLTIDSNNVINWTAQAAATGYKGGTSNGPRTSTTRTTTYQELGNVTSWTPPTPPCGTTYYYGVASEGPSGNQWSTNEVAIKAPACSTTFGFGLSAGWGSTSASDMAGTFGYDRFDTSRLGGTELPSTYAASGVKVDVLIPGDTSGSYNTGGVSAINISNWTNSALSWYQQYCNTTECPMLEVLNEPGGSWFWGSNATSSSNAAAYDSLLISVYNAFHNTYGSSSPKILASYDGGSSGSLNWGQLMWQANSSIGNYIDGITMHPYGGTSNSTASAQGNRTNVSNAHNATSKPVYVTEVGWPTDCSSGCPTTTNDTGDSLQWNETQQAANVYNFIAWAKSTGYVNAVILFNYRDYGTINWYGLERWNEGGSTSNGSKKPAWTAASQANLGQTCTVCQ